MSWQTLRDSLGVATVVIHGIEAIEHVTGIGGQPAELVLHTIESIISTVKEGLDAKTSPEVVLASLKALTDQLTSNDAAADKELNDRFDTSPGSKP